MYQAAATILALAVVGSAFGVEWHRQSKGILIDARFVGTSVFAICFGIVPIGVLLLESEDFGVFDWALSIDRSGPEFALATGLGLLGLFTFLAAYLTAWPGRLAERMPPIETMERGQWLPAIALSMLAIALISAIIMVRSVGGAWILIQYAMAFRSGEAPFATEWLFLRNLVLFALPASFLACGLMYSPRHDRKFWRLILVISVLLSVAGLLHLGGRLMLAAYLAVFAAYMFSDQQGRIRKSVVLLGLIATLVFIVVGKHALWVFIAPDTLEHTFQSILSDPLQLLVTPLLEFSFPVLSLANALVATPWEVPLRWFIDFPLAIVTLLPQKLLGLEQPMIVAFVNEELLNHPVPPDLLTTGYFSAGVLGALAMAAGLGLMSRFLDTLLRGNSPVVRLLSLAWAFLLGFRVMYGDPTHAAFSGLGLIICTGFMLTSAYLIRLRGSLVRIGN